CPSLWPSARASCGAPKEHHPSKGESVMHEECLICGAPLVYLTQDEEIECALCHRRERSKTRCQKGHYVCNTCHTRGLDQLVALCRREESRRPWTILEHLMAQPFCHM